MPREEQFTSAVVIGELYKGAYRSQATRRHLSNIEDRILPAVTVLPYDVAVAKVFGRVRPRLEEGTILADADLQIAATAIYHDLNLVRSAHNWNNGIMECWNIGLLPYCVEKYLDS